MVLALGTTEMSLAVPSHQVFIDIDGPGPPLPQAEQVQLLQLRRSRTSIDSGTPFLEVFNGHVDVGLSRLG